MSKRYEPDHTKIAEKIESGEYFKEAREWYTLLYLGPIPQRVFFLLVTTVSVIIFLVSLMAISSLLPIKPRVPFRYMANDIVNEIPRMVRFKEPQEPANPALIKYFLRTYVKMREGYTAERFVMQGGFVKQYSTPQLYQEYFRLTNPNSPRSPVRRYGKYVDIKVRINNVTYNREQIPSTATVNFSTNVIGQNEQKKTNWTATMTFEYTDLLEENYFDEKQQDYVLEFEEPTFKVLSYDVRERVAAAPN